MAEIKRHAIGDTPLPDGRILRLSCEHKLRVKTKFATAIPEIVVCDECTAIDNAIKEHLNRTESLRVLAAGYGGFWD